MKKNKIELFIGALFLLGLVTACSGDSFKPKHIVSETNTLGPLQCNESFLSFSDQVAPILQNRCSSCHGAGGSQTQFASLDNKSALSLSLRLIDLSNTDQSFLLKQSRNGHCKKALCEKPIQEKLPQALAHWAQAIKSCGGDQKIMKVSETPGYKYFFEVVRPALLETQQCQTCHTSELNLLRHPIYTSAFKTLEILSKVKSRYKNFFEKQRKRVVAYYCDNREYFNTKISEKNKKNLPSEKQCLANKKNIESIKVVDDDSLYIPPQYL